MVEYLYLLFDDSDHIGLDKHVFNTEVSVLNAEANKHGLIVKSGSYSPGLLACNINPIFNILIHLTSKYMAYLLHATIAEAQSPVRR